MSTSVAPPAPVVVVDGDAEHRKLLVALLHGASGLQCAASCGDIESALSKVAETRAALVVADLDSPEIPAAEAVRKLRDRHPSLLVVVLTVRADEASIFQALESGAIGYILKRGNYPLELMCGLASALDGGAPLSAAVAGCIVRRFHGWGADRRRMDALSAEESLVLERVAGGMRQKEIADELRCDDRTIRYSVARICKKLGVASRAEAVRLLHRSVTFRV